MVPKIIVTCALKSEFMILLEKFEVLCHLGTVKNQVSCFARKNYLSWMVVLLGSEGAYSRNLEFQIFSSKLLKYIFFTLSYVEIYFST